MRLKRTNKRNKKKGGYNKKLLNQILDKILKPSLLKKIKEQKNFYLNQFIKQTNFNNYLKVADIALKIIPERVFKPLVMTYTKQNPLMKSIVNKKYLTKKNAENIVEAVKNVLRFLQDDNIITDDYLSKLYDNYKDSFKKLFYKYFDNQENHITQDDLVTLLFNKNKFNLAYNFVISKIEDLKEKTKEYKINDEILIILKNDTRIRDEFYERFIKMFDSNDMNKIYENIYDDLENYISDNQLSTEFSNDNDNDKDKDNDNTEKTVENETIKESSDLINFKDTPDVIMEKIKDKETKELNDIYQKSKEKLLEDYGDKGEEYIIKFENKLLKIPEINKILKKSGIELTEKKSRGSSNSIGSSSNIIVNDDKNFNGSILSIPLLYDKYYSDKDHQNYHLYITKMKELLEDKQERLKILQEQKEKLDERSSEEKKQHIEIAKLDEESSKNSFNKNAKALSMFGSTLNNLLINIARTFAYLITNILNIFKIIGNMGQGIIIKLIFLIALIIAAIVVGVKYHENVKNADSMAFMKSNSKFLMFDAFNGYNGYDNLYNNTIEYIKGFIPFNVINSFNLLNNNISYMATGQNIYDKHLTKRDETTEGRCDNIFHINYKTNYDLINDKQKTYCTIQPNDIILNYNENNNPVGDYNKLDIDIKNDINFYNYYHIPILPNNNTGKYELDLNNSTFNNVPSQNTDARIKNALSKYNLIKSNKNNTNLVLNTFNNIYYDTKAHINNTSTSDSYSAYGIYLLNPNYSGLNIAIIDIDFKKDNFSDRDKGNNNLDTYISKSDFNKNIYYVKISKKNPNYIYITKNENDKTDEKIPIFDFWDSHNKDNISILKLYNQIETLSIYDLKYNIPSTNNYVIPPKLRYDDNSKRFYIDFFQDGDYTTFLKMDKGANGSINPIYEINVDVSKLHHENDNDRDCDNYFLLFPSLDNDSLFRNDATNQELTDFILNFQNSPDAYAYSYNNNLMIYRKKNNDYNNPENRKYDNINLLNNYYKNNYCKNNDYYNKYFSLKNNNKDTTNQYIIDKVFISFAFLLYFIINYYSRCVFFINLYDYKNPGASYSIYLISNNDDGGNLSIFGPKSGLGGQDYGEWKNNEIFKIDMTKYPNMRTNTKYFKNKSIQSIGSSIINFGKNTKIYNGYLNDKEIKKNLHKNLFNGGTYENDFLLEKNLYYREPKSFIGRLYSLKIDRY